MNHRCIFAALVIFCASCIAYPAEQENPDIINSTTTLVDHRMGFKQTESLESKPLVPKVPKQDVDAGSATDDAYGANIANQITTIFLGLLTGNINSIFSGSAGFIDDMEAQKTINGILTNVAKPFNEISETFVKNTLQFLNASSTSPRSTTARRATGAAATSGEEDDDELQEVKLSI